MLEAMKKAANFARTENGAATLLGSGSDCLDLFATIGALRGQSDSRAISAFWRAYAEDPDMAMKILFFARDVRGGLGERETFRVILRALAMRHPASVRKNLARIPEFGRWDDLLALMGTFCQADMIGLIRAQLKSDRESAAKDEPISLLAKWLPSPNASSAQTVWRAKGIARGLGMSEAAYRKTLSALRAYGKILENNLREKDYTFDYAAQPSGAMFKYRKAFHRNDAERYQAYLDRVAQGGETLHTGTLAPYQIVEALLGDVNEAEMKALDVTWNALNDFTRGENALVVVDGSGSMYYDACPMPAAVAMSLGMYYAQRNRGAFHNHFITFSENPRLVEIKGRDIAQKTEYCMSFNECANTNIARVFELVLDAALRAHVPQAELPSTLYIISDMEFDACAEDADATNFEYAKALYAKNGYALPRVVFWNVSSHRRQQPVSMNEQGVVLVSGCSPHIFELATQGAITPYAYMQEVLSNERYAGIVA